MKIKLAILLFIVVNSLCYSQDNVYDKRVNQDIIPKSSVKIVISNNETAKQNFSKVLKIAIENDIFIESRDTSVNYIKTQPKEIKKGMGLYFMNIVSKDNEIVISGMAKGAYQITFGGVTSANEYEQIIYRGMNGSFFKTSFEVMNEFAKKFNGNISYKQ